MTRSQLSVMYRLGGPAEYAALTKHIIENRVLNGEVVRLEGANSSRAIGRSHFRFCSPEPSMWMTLMVRMEKLGAFALTEPEHGSDAVRLETSARREDDEYVVDGEKKWIGNVGAFLIEKGTPGFFPQVMTGKTAMRASWQARMVGRDIIGINTFA
jgi:glutaryl-CoA dehydrogenase